MDELTEQQINEYREVFALFDKDNLKFIPSTELGMVMRTLGQNPTKEEV